MACQVDSAITQYEWVQKMLCQAMKLLSVEQIKSFKGIDAYHPASEWYFSHLREDYRKNDGHEKEVATKELERLGFIIEENEKHITFKDTKGISSWGGAKIVK
jgi:hypothetical protein